MNDIFQAYTRSTAFSLSLSSSMVDRLMTRRDEHDRDLKGAELSARFPWYRYITCRPLFVTEDGMYLDRSDQALARRGLVEVGEVPAMYGELSNGDIFDEDEAAVPAIKLTSAGLILTDLLIEAGFERKPQERWRIKVPPHPDDRFRINLDQKTEEWMADRYGDKPHDRRLDLMEPGDEPFLMGFGKFKVRP